MKTSDLTHSMDFKSKLMNILKLKSKLESDQMLHRTEYILPFSQFKVQFNFP